MTQTLAVFTKNRTNPAYAAARLGADRVARAFGAETSHYVPAKPDDIAEQIALIDTALARKPDAIILVPVHPTAINAAIRKIVTAGVPLIGYLNPYSEPGPIAFVGSDDYALGARIAAYLYEHLGGRGDVVIVAGPPGSITCLERLRGFHDAKEKYPEIRLVKTVCGDYQHDVTLKAAESLLDSGVHFDAILAANDVMALAMIEALDAAGRSSTVVGVNAVPDAITSIRNGKLLATIDFDAMKIAAVATEAALRYLRGERVPAEIILPVEIVDRSNYAAWDKPFAERPLVPWEEAVKSVVQP
jgi:ribose transport system substrate-binding protein